jgi:environmental stress-induced protein Ves
MEVRHLNASDVRRQPWKNGRGSTDELAIWPEGGALERGDFEWRISRARVDRSGPFSCFSGCDRLLTVIEGEGLVLVHGDAAARSRLHLFEPHRFPGEWPTVAELPAGGIVDLGVVFRRGRVEAAVQVLELGRRSARESLEPGHAFVHVLSGSALARVTGEEEPFSLRRHESLWLRSVRAGEEIDLVGRASACVVVLVALRDA